MSLFSARRPDVWQVEVWTSGRPSIHGGCFDLCEGVGYIKHEASGGVTLLRPDRTIAAMYPAGGWTFVRERERVGA